MRSSKHSLVFGRNRFGDVELYAAGRYQVHDAGFGTFGFDVGRHHNIGVDDNPNQLADFFCPISV